MNSQEIFLKSKMLALVLQSCSYQQQVLLIKADNGVFVCTLILLPQLDITVILVRVLILSACIKRVSSWHPWSLAHCVRVWCF